MSRPRTPVAPPEHRHRVRRRDHRRRPAVHRDGTVFVDVSRAGRGDRSVADRRGARRRRAHLWGAADRSRRGCAAPRHQAAQHLPVRLRRAGARRFRDLHDRRRAQPQRRQRGLGRLRGARGARGQPGIAGGRRVLAGGDAVPVDRRRIALREPRHEDHRPAHPHRGAAPARSPRHAARARSRPAAGARQGSGGRARSPPSSSPR